MKVQDELPSDADAGMNGVKALEAFPRELAVEIQSGPAVPINHGDMGPVGQRNREHQQRWEIVNRVLENADAISAYGQTGTGLAGLGKNFVPGRGKKRIVALQRISRHAGVRFVRQGGLDFRFDPGCHGKGVGDVQVWAGGRRAEDGGRRADFRPLTSDLRLAFSHN